MQEKVNKRHPNKNNCSTIAAQFHKKQSPVTFLLNWQKCHACNYSRLSNKQNLSNKQFRDLVNPSKKYDEG